MVGLLLKSILGLAFLVALLALAIFASAGTLRFWRAWVYLGVFALCSLLITVYLFRYDKDLLARRVKAGPTAETEKSQQVIQGIASLAFVGVYVVAGLDYRFHWSTVPPVVSVIADGVVALGFLIVFFVFRENSYTSALIEVAQEQQVIETGPYHVVRHPMYSGASLLVVFTPLALGSWVALLCAVALVLVIVGRLVDEEQYLSANLSGYEAYRRKVRYRLVPFLW